MIYNFFLNTLMILSIFEKMLSLTLHSSKSSIVQNYAIFGVKMSSLKFSLCKKYDIWQVCCTVMISIISEEGRIIVQQTAVIKI